MNIAQLQRLQSSGLHDEPRALPRPRDNEAQEGPGFSELLEQAVSQVDATQKEADHQVTAFVTGEQENLHEVVLSLNQAQLSFQLMTEVRNKMLETYQELMRLQV